MQGGLEDCQIQAEVGDTASRQASMQEELGEVEGAGRLQERGCLARRRAQKGSEWQEQVFQG